MPQGPNNPEQQHASTPTKAEDISDKLQQVPTPEPVSDWFTIAIVMLPLLISIGATVVFSIYNTHLSLAIAISAVTFLGFLALTFILLRKRVKRERSRKRLRNLLLAFGSTTFFVCIVVLIERSRKPEAPKPPDANVAKATPSNRPYVFFKVTALKKPLTIGEKPVIQYVLSNSGLMEAHIKFWDNTYYFDTQPFKNAFKYTPYQSSSADLAPTAEVNGELRYDFLVTKEKLEALQSGKAQLYFFSRGEYRGEDGTVYPFQFCRMYDKEMSGNLILCPDDILIE